MKTETRKGWGIALILLFVANLATLGYFWYMRLEAVPPAPPGTPENFVKESLNLSAAQASAYEQLLQDHRRNVRLLRDSLRRVKDDFFSEVSKAEVDSSAVEKKAEAAAMIEKKIDLLTLEHFRKVKALCTPEQQQTFQSVIRTIIRRGPPPPPRPGGPPGRFNEGGAPDGPPPGEDGPPPPPPGNP